ncbi:MAG: hypothetical protein GH155_03730 [Spirochaeta sp.]|nr:hypothetical protein [Spirochaeta sp.]
MDNFKLPSEISPEKWPAPEVFIEEAEECVQVAREKGIVIRVMGGLAIYLHCQNFKDLWKKLGRLGKKIFTDIDYVSYGKHRVKLMKLFEQRGFTINQQMLYHYGKTRQIYYGEKVPMAEIFFDRLMMNHTIPYNKRLEEDFPTTPLAELLLQKVQMVRMNEKDIKDTIILLRSHDIGSDDKEKINKLVIGASLLKDWGFYYTATGNLKKIGESLQRYEVLAPEDRQAVRDRIDELLDYLEKEPKGGKWKIRAKVGRKIKWYKEVDEWDVIPPPEETV